jgi:hypothetical protein
MKRIRGLVLVGFSIIMMVLMGAQMVSVSNAATREDNIEKIKDYLSNEKVIEGLEKRWASPETIIKSLDSFSDSQIEELANHANFQVGGAIDDSGVSDFWKTWGLIIIIGALAPILLFAILRV